MEHFQDIKIFKDMRIILNMEVKHNTLYHTTFDRRIQFFVGDIKYSLRHFINSC